MSYQASTPAEAIQCFEPTPNAVYSIETVARIGDVSRRTLALFYKYGLLAPVGDPESSGYCFDEQAIRRLRQIEYLRNVRGVNLCAIGMILELMEKMENLESEVRSLRKEMSPTDRQGNSSGPAQLSIATDPGEVTNTSA